MANAIKISLIQLIAQPEKFAEQRVQVIGLCALKFEGKAIWISRDDLRYSITKNAVWLDIPLNEESCKFDQKYVFVEGRFTAKNRGHLGLYSGTIEDISRIFLQRSSENPRDGDGNS
jgi:hypothetical protein